MAKAVAKASGEHAEREDDPWTIDIPDHPQRTETPEFRNSKEAFDKIMASLSGQPYGPGPWQAHHGGSLWVYDSGWRLFLNTAGVEWSAQFAADPAKIDILRQNAQRLYSAFPNSLAKLKGLGYKSTALISDEITDAKGVALWTDSIFNSCVPLASPIHVGSVTTRSPFGGIHHYPKPIWDIQFFKQDDFSLWVTDSATKAKIAVVPAAPRGAGDSRVEVVYAPEGHPLHKRHLAAHQRGKRLILPADHPLSKQAFRKQG